MSARIANASLAMLRLRRGFDIDAVTVWVGVMGVLAAATATVLLQHAS